MDRVSEYDSYNSYNFESRIANYAKKQISVLKKDDSSSSLFDNCENKQYIIPKSKVEYTKDEYPSNTLSTEKEGEAKYTPEFSTNNDYEYESYTREIKNNNNNNVYNKGYGINVNDFEYNSVDDHKTDAKYFASEIDPK